MNSNRLLQTAACLAALQGIVHLVLIAIAKPTHGHGEIELVEQMKTRAFLFAGNWRTYWGFYTGYAYMAGGWCLIQALLLWQFAALHATAGADVRPSVTVLLAANIIHAGITLRLFFPLPALFDALIAGCLAGALFLLPRTA